MNWRPGRIAFWLLCRQAEALVQMFGDSPVTCELLASTFEDLDSQVSSLDGGMTEVEVGFYIFRDFNLQTNENTRRRGHS